MALTLRRWILAALLGCGVTAIAYLPPSQPRYQRFTDFQAFANQDVTPERMREKRIQAHLQGAQHALAIALRRDTLTHLLQRDAPRPGVLPGLLFEGTVPDWARRAILASFDSLWRRLEPKSAEIRMTVVIEARPFEFGARSTYFLPPATDGHTCVATVTPHWQLSRLMRYSTPPTDSFPLQPWLRSGQGPCAFYAAFGRPGPRIEEWLLDREFDLGSEPEWNAPDLRPDWVTSEAIYWNVSFDGIACAGGNRARCRVALFTPDDSFRGRGPPPSGRRTHQQLRGIVSRPRFWDINLFQGSRYLSDLVRTMGTERFDSFWRSPSPVDSAFFHAFGVPIETYTQIWARRQMGRVSVTPALRPQTVLFSLTFAGLMLAGLTLYSIRRQIG
jgi:hypothetical protein